MTIKHKEMARLINYQLIFSMKLSTGRNFYPINCTVAKVNGIT